MCVVITLNLHSTLVRADLLVTISFSQEKSEFGEAKSFVHGHQTYSKCLSIAQHCVSQSAQTLIVSLTDTNSIMSIFKI